MVTNQDRKSLVRVASTLPQGDSLRRAIIAGLMHIAKPDYNKYLERKQKEGKKPLPREEWEARVMNTGHSDENKTYKKQTFKKVKNEGVKALAREHDLEDDEMHDLVDQAKSLADKNAKKRMSPEERKAKFLKNMDRSKYDSPEDFQRAQERVKKMNAGDFEKMVFAIADEEEEAPAGKTASYRLR